MGRTIHATAVVDRRAELGDGVVIGPNAVIGADVVIGDDCEIGAAAHVEGPTRLGRGNHLYPKATVGFDPQDQKWKGETVRLEVGEGNIFREFCTVHRGTGLGGGVTTIGDGSLFMVYTHIAHDCHIGNDVIFGNAATLAGHVDVEDFANIGAFSGVHQFCRVGQHAFIGGYSVVTKDALPYAKTVGNRARIYGINTIGLARRGFSPETIAKLRRAYRYLFHSNTSRALAQIEREPGLQCPEVRYVVEFIRSSKRGVGLRRPSRRLEEVMED
jgi:UDP-N-acetylglucosamine acyltransferase